MSVLKEKGLKSTKNRNLVIEILNQAQEPMNAEAIFIKIREQREVNFSTVYRTLTALTQAAIIIKNQGVDGKAYYQINNHNHRHYLVCAECKKKIVIDSCPMELIGQKLEAETGFHITGHNLEFVGECPECLKKDK